MTSANKEGRFQWGPEMQLLANLAEINVEFCSSNNPHVQRAAYIKTLNAFWDFLRELPDFRTKHIRVLSYLVYDLKDLDEGRQPKRLEKSYYSKARRRTSNVMMLELAEASAFVDYLVEGGLSSEQAAKAVINRAKEIGAALPPEQPGKQMPDYKRLLNWRKNIRRRAKPGTEHRRLAKEIYDLKCHHIRCKMRQHGWTAIEAAEAHLEFWRR